MKKIFGNLVLCIMAVAAFGLTSCEGNDPKGLTPDQFEKRSAVGFYEGDKALYLFNTNKDQLYFNKTTNTFRIMVDEGDKYIEVALASAVPTKGATVKGTVTNNGFGSIKNYKSVDFEVLKKNGENCWLWCGAENLGVVIFFIP